MIGIGVRFVARTTKSDNIAAAPAFTCIVPNRKPVTNTKNMFSTSIYILVMVVEPSLLAVTEVSKPLITNPLLIRTLSQFCTLSILSTHSLFLPIRLMLSGIFLLSLPSWTNPTKILYTFLVSPLATKCPVRGSLMQFTTNIKQFR